MIKGDNILNVGTPAGGGISIISNDPVTSGGGGGGDAPPITTELQLYINPEADVYSDTGTTLAVDGDSIRQINDQSTNAFTLDQSTGSQQYEYATDSLGTGNAGFHKFTVSDHMDFSSTVTIPGATKSLTFYAVYKRANNGNISYLYGPVDNNYNRIIQYSNTIYIQDEDADTISANSTKVLNQIVIKAYVLDTSTNVMTTYLNGSQENTTTLSKTWANFNFSTFWGGGMTGYIGSVLLYSDSHDATDVGTISDWLNTKYSIY